MPAMTQNNLYAPWRIDYLRRLNDGPKPECFLCDAWQKPDQDAQNKVLYRAEQTMIIMNHYPYTNGHLMVCLGDHIGDLTDMSPDQRAELMETTHIAEQIIRATLNPQGINVGINIGEAAGAGLPGHLHIHLVPRWAGDTNFIDVVGQVRVIPMAMEQIYDEMLTASQNLNL